MSPSTIKTDSTGSPATSSSLSPEDIARAAEFSRIFGEGVRDAQEESRRLGVPNVYTINGVLHYELPNGELTTEDPFPAMQAIAGKDKA